MKYQIMKTTICKLVMLAAATAWLAGHAPASAPSDAKTPGGRWSVRYDDGHETILDIRTNKVAMLFVTGAAVRTGRWEVVGSTGAVFRATFSGQPPLSVEGRIPADGTLRLRSAGPNADELRFKRAAPPAKTR